VSLRDWLKNGWLVEHESSAEEICALLALVDRDLRDCQTPGLSTDWRFNIAHHAALQTAAAALAAAGFRATREAHHYRVIQSLAFTLKADAELVHRFDAFRKKRNLSSYEMGGAISDLEVEEMIALASDLRHRVERWIRRNHPELL
jgi:hypothetical protein